MTRKTEQPDAIDRYLASWHDELPPIDMEVEGIVERIGWLYRNLKRSMNETLEEFGVTHGEWSTLAYLKRKGPPYRGKPGRLADHAGLTSGAMTNRLDRLEEAGLVQRQPDPEDRRVVQVELTKAGHKLVEHSIAAQAHKEQQVASSLDARERRQLNELLRRLVVELERD